MHLPFDLISADHLCRRKTKLEIVNCMEEDAAETLNEL